MKTVGAGTTSATLRDRYVAQQAADTFLHTTRQQSDTRVSGCRVLVNDRIILPLNHLSWTQLDKSSNVLSTVEHVVSTGGSTC